MKNKTNLEKTTLGDITELASLKNEMEKEQKKEIAEKKAEMASLALDEKLAQLSEVEKLDATSSKVQTMRDAVFHP